MWKPGQLVTINNRVYRVKKVDETRFKRHPYLFGICDLCQRKNSEIGTPCVRSNTFSSIVCSRLTGMYGYLEPIY